MTKAPGSRKQPSRAKTSDSRRLTVERIQTGLRMEKRILLVLKALAGTLDLSLGDLLEGIVLHSFEGRAPFSSETRSKIAALKKVFDLDLVAEDSHLLVEAHPTTDS